ncbi:steroid 21-hydroxylase-like [Chlamydotis macqueenii]
MQRVTTRPRVPRATPTRRNTHLGGSAAGDGARAPPWGPAGGTYGGTCGSWPPVPPGATCTVLSPPSVGGVPVAPGTVLIPNLLAAQRDPCTWQHPDTFLPERFLAPGAPWRALVPFGCGARACPGEGLARAELLAFLSALLRHFRLLPAAPGALPSLRGAAGTVLRCAPFRVRLVPRHA